MTSSTNPDGIWPAHPHDAVAAVTALADGVGGVVALAAGLATSGRRVDLTGLDDSVGLLCAKALDLPPSEAQAARVALLGLLKRIDLLSLELRAAGP